MPGRFQDALGQVQSVSGEEEKEEALWEKIESVRHQLTRSLNPAKLTPYLRQCRVIDEQDEEEVLSSCRFPCKSNRTGHLIDILRSRGKRGYEAFLESLEFYYPEQFIRLTGREPAQRCSMILDEEGPEGLTQFLMMEVKKVRAQRQEHLLREHQLQVKNQALEQEQARLEQRLQELLKVQERYQRLREEWDSHSMELLRLKDENYMLAMRYAQLCEEKNMAVLRSRDLQLVVDQLKCKVTSLEEECNLLRKHMSTMPQREAEEQSHSDMVSDLWTENQRLTVSLQELQGRLQVPASETQVPGSEQILLDILEHDWKEAQDDRQELCQKLHSVQNELQWAEELRDKYLQEMEDLQLKYRTLQKDCDLYKHRMNTVLSQLEEIEKERDQAIQSRDGVQLQYSLSLVEKDQYRKRVRTLEEERDKLLSELSKLEGLNSSLEAQVQRYQGTRDMGKKMFTSSHSLCSNLSSTWSLSDNPSPLVAGLTDPLGVSPHNHSGGLTQSEKEINRLSTFPFPPCVGSILRRQREDRCVTCSLPSLSPLGSGTTSASMAGLSSSSSSLNAGRVQSELCLSSLSDRMEPTRRCLPLIYSSLRTLLTSVSLMPGYQPLREALQEGKKIPGDSFYVRANLPLLEQSNPCALCVKCRDILHVTDTMHKGRQEWYCSRVDPLTLRDLDRGTVPNYSRAQQLLKMLEKGQVQGRQRGYRNNVSCGRKQWKMCGVFVGGLGAHSPLPLLSMAFSHLVPYILVHPLVVPGPRPVVLSPGCIVPRLIRNLLDLPNSRQDFHVCPAETLGEEELATTSPQVARGVPQDQQENGKIHTIREAMSKNKHCLLELGVQSVRDLIKSEIYPIVIHVEVTEKNIRRLRSLLGKLGQRDSEVLKLCRSAEQALHSLPCSWARVDPQSWCHAEELVKVVRGCIFQEQTKVVWVEVGEP
uniref:Caspase recruitment domain family member 10 n=1 Tax=Crocodylus porosus TaxID=8502 RepID=A0A7M4FRI2_CROPO